MSAKKSSFKLKYSMNSDLIFWKETKSFFINFLFPIWLINSCKLFEINLTVYSPRRSLAYQNRKNIFDGHIRSAALNQRWQNTFVCVWICMWIYYKEITKPQIKTSYKSAAPKKFPSFANKSRSCGPSFRLPPVVGVETMGVSITTSFVGTLTVITS